MARSSGNAIFPGIGLCNPHIRICGDRAYLYATHDKGPDTGNFTMDDWWIWSAPDLVHWKHECTIRPEETYYGKPDSRRMSTRVCATTTSRSIPTATARSSSGAGSGISSATRWG